MHSTPSRLTTTQRPMASSSATTPSTNLASNSASTSLPLPTTTTSNAASNRQNRKLLFGARDSSSSVSSGSGTGNGGTTVLDIEAENARTEHAMYENEGKISTLSDRVGMMKEIAGQIHGDVKAHNEMLEMMKGKFGGAKTMLDKVMAGMRDMIESEKEGNKYFWRYVGLIVLACLGIYWLLKK